MTLYEIKDAVNAGKTVCFKDESCTVQKGGVAGQWWLVKKTMDLVTRQWDFHVVGLQSQGFLGHDQEDFFIL